MEEEEIKPACVTCGKTGSTLTDDGLCFGCLAKKFERPDDEDNGTWFGKA